jgi:hypothetical protein
MRTGGKLDAIDVQLVGVADGVGDLDRRSTLREERARIEQQVEDGKRLREQLIARRDRVRILPGAPCA